VPFIKETHAFEQNYFGAQAKGLY